MTLFRDKYRIESSRLSGWDYASNGSYFITICAFNHQKYFGTVENLKMNLSDIGKIVNAFFSEIPNHFQNATLDEYRVMPDHIHGIIIIDNDRTNRDDGNGGKRRGVAMQRLYVCNDPNPANKTKINNDIPGPVGDLMSKISPKPQSLSVMVRSFKSICTRTINEFFPAAGFQWQPRFHDHIIRNDIELERIRWYIRNNPRNWKKEDKGDWSRSWDRVF